MNNEIKQGLMILFSIILIAMAISVILITLSPAPEEKKDASLQQVILIGIDGMQYNHYKELLNDGNLLNFPRLIGVYGLDTNASITGHTNTSTKPGNAELNSGLGSSITGIVENDSNKTLLKGASVFERLHSFRKDISIGMIYGKQTAYIPDLLFRNAKDSIGWWRSMEDYNHENYVSSSYANSIDVAKEAAKFIIQNKDNNFYLLVYFGVPDGAGHKYGENSNEYSSAIINVDDGIGLLLDILDGYGLRDNVKIIVSGDHGWNEGTANHSVNDFDTNTIALISNDANLINGFYAGTTKRQCDIAPTILSYFGMTPSDYSDITSFGCGSLSQ